MATARNPADASTGSWWRQNTTTRESRDEQDQGPRPTETVGLHHMDALSPCRASGRFIVPSLRGFRIGSRLTVSHRDLRLVVCRRHGRGPRHLVDVHQPQVPLVAFRASRWRPQGVAVPPRRPSRPDGDRRPYTLARPRCRPFRDGAVHHAARVAHQIQRLHRTPHHAEGQPPFEDERLDGADAATRRARRCR